MQEVFATYGLANVIVLKPDQRDRKASFKKEKGLPFEVWLSSQYQKHGITQMLLIKKNLCNPLLTTQTFLNIFSATLLVRQQIDQLRATESTHSRIRRPFAVQA